MSVRIELARFRDVDVEGLDADVSLYFWGHYTVEPKEACGGWIIREHYGPSGKPYPIVHDLGAFFRDPPARTELATEVATLEDARRFLGEQGPPDGQGR